MISIAALLPITLAQADLLKQIASHYRSLKRFEAEIEHHDDSGLFPGSYVQKLIWTGHGKFTLKVTKPSKATPKAPDYVAENKVVTSTLNGKVIRRESVDPRPTSSPGWEVSGGLILMFLQNTPTAKLLLDTPKEFKLSWKMGKTTRWQGLAVREMVGSFDKKDAIHLYLHPNQPKVIGMQSLKGASGWMVYRNVKES